MSFSTGLYLTTKWKNFSTKSASNSSSDENQEPKRRQDRKMDTAVLCIGDLLTDAYQIVVPIYQRVYEWETEEVEKLLDDFVMNLDSSMESNQLKVSDSTPPSHLMLISNS